MEKTLQVTKQRVEYEVFKDHHNKLQAVPTLHALIVEYIRTRMVNLAAATVEKMIQHLSEFEEFCYREKWDKFILQRFQDHLFTKTLSLSSIRVRMDVLKAFSSWMERMDYVDPGPHHYVERIRCPIRLQPPVFTTEEYELLKKEAHGDKYYLLVVCGWATGLRISDICTLKWKSVDFDQLMITTCPRKTIRTGKEVKISIEPDGDLHKHLLLMQKHIDIHYEPEKWTEYVSPAIARAYHKGRNSPSVWFRNLLERCGLRDSGKNFHTFRHTMHSRLANAGIPFPIAAAITGNTDPLVFQRYVRPSDRAIREALHKAKMEETLNELEKAANAKAYSKSDGGDNQFQAPKTPEPGH